jgi:hypothetical protein
LDNQESKKLSGHTYLGEILKPVFGYIDNYNWILSDLDGGAYYDLPIDYEHDYFVLPSPEFKKILNSDMQFYWGVIIAVPISLDVKIDENNLPYAEGNEVIWKEGNLQYPNAEIEIACVDSSYTIVKFNNQELSEKFIDYFTEAKPLEKFTHKYLKFVK